MYLVMVHNVHIIYECIVKQILSYIASGYNATLYKILSIDVLLNKKELIEFPDFHTKARCVRH